MSETVIQVMGHVGTDVDLRDLGNGLHLSTFRLASTPRHYERAQRGFVDGPTNWLSVQCWRSLAEHVHQSIRRGDPVIVIGRLKTQEWVKDGQQHSRFILEATSVGHDLTRGVSSFTKTTKATEAQPDHTKAAVEAAQQVEEANAGLAGLADPFAE